jgi:hypothetical protein
VVGWIGELASLLVRLAVKRIVEEALEGAVRDLLGREYYARRGERQGYRNGYRKGRLATGEGEVSYAIAQVRDADATGIAELRERLSGRTEALEKLAIEMCARGCSTRDIEATFANEQGRSLLSRTTVSEVTEALWEEYEALATRDLSDVKPLFLFPDGVAEKLQPGARREAVTAAWCITCEGTNVLVHLAPGSKESTDSAVEFLQDCSSGWRSPLAGRALHLQGSSGRFQRSPSSLPSGHLIPLPEACPGAHTVPFDGTRLPRYRPVAICFLCRLIVVDLLFAACEKEAAWTDSTVVISSS